MVSCCIVVFKFNGKPKVKKVWAQDIKKQSMIIIYSSVFTAHFYKCYEQI